MIDPLPTHQDQLWSQSTGTSGMANPSMANVQT